MRCPAWARQDRQGARRDPAQLVRPDDREPGRPGPDHDHASRASRWPRPAARSSTAHPSSSSSPRKASASMARPSRRRRRLPASSSSASRSASWPPSRRGIFPTAMITRKAGPALAAGCTVVSSPPRRRRSRPSLWPSSAERAGDPARACSTSSPAAPATIGGELTANPLVRMLTFTGSTEVGKVLHARNAPRPSRRSAGARRQRAVHRLRRCRSRRGGGGRHGLEIPQCRADLRVRQPHPGAGRASTTPSPRSSRAAVAKMKVGPGTEHGVTTGPLINKAAVEKVEEHIADALAKGAKVVAGGKRHARAATSSSRRSCADVTRDMMVAARGDLRPGGAALPLQDRGRGDRHGQRHRVRPRLPISTPATSAASGGSPRRWNTASSASMKGIISTEVGAFRRRQGIRHRPRRLASRHRGIHSRSNTC